VDVSSLKSKKQERASKVLAEGGTEQEAATAAGVKNRSTVSKWTRDPAFMERVEELRGSDVRLGDLLSQMAVPAAETLLRVLRGKNEDGSPLSGDDKLLQQQVKIALSVLPLARSRRGGSGDDEPVGTDPLEGLDEDELEQLANS